tara:strand:+ start:1257 stop:1868 length:612 start_codon:yes stop_codon:yes gene_type:complete
MSSPNPLSWVEDTVDAVIGVAEEVADWVGDATQEVIDFTGDVVGTAYHETMAFTSSVTGIDELDPDYNEDLEAEYMAQLAAQQAEFAKLQTQLNSASAIDRMNAEKRMAELKGSHDKWIRQSKAKFRRQKLQGDIEHRKAMAEKEAEIAKAAQEKGQGDIGYNKEAMQTIARKARAMPTIPAMDAPDRGVGSTTRDTPPRRPI